MIDFPHFWEHVATVVLMSRVQIAFDLATDEIWAARVFRACSATARLRVIARVLALQFQSAPDEPRIVSP